MSVPPVAPSGLTPATSQLRHPPEAGAHSFAAPASGVAFLVLGVVLGIGMILASTAVYAVEGGMTAVAALLPLGYAFAAGMVATVNPCGVLLLPSLVAFYLGQGPEAPVRGWDRAGRALALGLMATLGFVAIFGLVGAVVGVGGRALAAAFPYGGLAVGVGLIGLGGWLALSGHELGILAAGQAMGRVRLGPQRRSLFFFGIAYALASLACTLPIFLVVVGSALASQGAASAVLQFLSYALGMGLVLILVILGAAFFQSFVARSVRRVAPFVQRASAAFLLGAGMYVVHYWLSNL